MFQSLPLLLPIQLMVKMRELYCQQLLSKKKKKEKVPLSNQRKIKNTTQTPNIKINVRSVNIYIHDNMLFMKNFDLSFLYLLKLFIGIIIIILDLPP